jgi:hypothetical protein
MHLAAICPAVIAELDAARGHFAGGSYPSERAQANLRNSSTHYGKTQRRHRLAREMGADEETSAA